MAWPRRDDFLPRHIRRRIRSSSRYQRKEDALARSCSTSRTWRTIGFITYPRATPPPLPRRSPTSYPPQPAPLHLAVYKDLLRRTGGLLVDHAGGHGSRYQTGFLATDGKSYRLKVSIIVSDEEVKKGQPKWHLQDGAGMRVNGEDVWSREDTPLTRMPRLARRLQKEHLAWKNKYDEDMDLAHLKARSQRAEPRRQPPP